MYNLSKGKSAFSENSLNLLKFSQIRNITALLLSYQKYVYFKRLKMSHFHGSRTNAVVTHRPTKKITYWMIRNLYRKNSAVNL